MLAEPLPAPVAPVAIDEIKAFLRLDNPLEDALLAGFVRTATALAEAFTGQRLIARDFAETLPGAACWTRLSAAPVVAIIGIDGAAGALPGGTYESDIDLAGNGWVRVPAGGRITVRFRAGLAADWNGVPEPLRQGIVRLVSHFHAHRDAPDASGPPAAVAALWRPWRRMRLG